jgi:hypothetical protein
MAACCLFGPTLAVLALGLSDGAAETPSGPLVIVCRAVTLDRDHWRYWQVDYRLRNEGKATLTIPPSEIVVQVDGWVSNSRSAGHATPRRSLVTASGSTGLTGVCELIASGDEAQRCRERATIQVWQGSAGDNPPDPIAKAGVRSLSLHELPTLTVCPGEELRARVRLEHEHFLYGPYTTLLGPRTLELRLGPALLHDVLPLDRDRRVARAEATWPPRPPVELLDTHIFVSPPDSLHLEAHTPGKLSHRFPERPVKYSTLMRLSFWYLIAPGSEGEYRARVAQYKDSPTSWKTLPDGELEQCLSAVGRWTRVDRVFRTEPEATSLSLDFRIMGAEVGDLWLDDVSLEPVGERPEEP